MKFKKNLLLPASLVLCATLSLVGCGGTSANGEDTTPTKNTASDDNEATTTPEQPQGIEVPDISPFAQLELPAVGEEIAIVTTNMGEIKIKFFPEQAPKAVENFKTLAAEGYYDGITFHRVISDFMIQGGDPTATGSGGESMYGEAFEDEFHYNLRNYKGALSMANSGVNTNGSQFFIVQASTIDPSYAAQVDLLMQENPDGIVKVDERTQDVVTVSQFYSEDVMKNYSEVGGTLHLDYGHTVFGQTFEGIEVVDAIANVETVSDKPVEDVVIESIAFVAYEG